MAEEIKVVIGADSSQLAAELKQAENNLKKFQAALAKSTDVNEIKYLEKNIGLLNQKIAGLSNTMPKAAAASNQATQSLTNLSRIAQDAPFGFIAIQNNISPLIESFGRLKAETGTTGGALKSLVSGLAGPAGLGLAVSVGTALLTTFASKMGKSKEEVDAFAKSLNDAKASALTTSVNLQSLIKVAQDETKSNEQRNEALKRANKIMGDYGEKLTLANIATEKITKQTELFTQALINEAIAAKYADKIADLTIKQSEARLELAKNEQFLAKIRRQVAGEQVNLNTGTTKSSSLLAIAQGNVVREQENLNAISKQLTDTTNLLNQAQSIATNNFGQIGTKAKESADKTKKAGETIDSVIAQLRKDIQDENILGRIFGTPRFDVIKKDFDLVKSTIETLVTKFNLDPSDKRLLKLQIELGSLEGRLTPEQQIRDTINKIKVPDFVFKIKPRVDGDIKNLNTGLVKLGEELQKSVENIANNIAVTFGETLGEALIGQATFGDFFRNIFGVIGQGLQDLGKQIIVAAKLFSTIQKTLAARPELALLAGIALIAVGGVIRSLTSRNAFAVGTRNAPGGLALVGERGPELVNLPRGSQVIPAAQTSQMMGGVGGSVEVFGVLRGQDIFFSNKKYGQTYGRTT